MICEALLVIGTIFVISVVVYACLVASSENQKQSEEDFKVFLEEKERVKNGRHNDVQ